MKNIPFPVSAEKIERTLAREHDEGKTPRYVPEIPDRLQSALGFPNSSPEVRRAFRKAWLAFRKYDRRQSRANRGRTAYVGEAHAYEGRSRNWRSLIVADWILWKMCPEVERPLSWPKSEKELAERWKIAHGTLNGMVIRVQGQMLLSSMLLPFDAEDLNRRADRLLTQTLEEQERLRPVDRDPRWVDIAYKRTGAVQKANFTKNTINVSGNLTQNVLQLSAEERQAAEERLRLHAQRHFREVPRETEAVELLEGPDGEQRGAAETQPPPPGDDPSTP